jgi:hypothetical protein
LGQSLVPGRNINSWHWPFTNIFLRICIHKYTYLFTSAFCFINIPYSLPKYLYCDADRLNNLQRTKLSRCRIIWLLPHVLYPLFRYQIVSLSQCSCVSPVVLWVVDGGGGGAKSFDGEKDWTFIFQIIQYLLAGVM